MKHPLFSKLSMPTIMTLLKSQALAFVFLKKYQVLYKEGDTQPIVYLPVYGNLTLWKRCTRTLGTSIRLGYTLGEEAFMDRRFTHR